MDNPIEQLRQDMETLQKTNQVLKEKVEALEAEKQQWNELKAKEEMLMEQERNLRVQLANIERDSAIEFKKLVKDYFIKHGSDSTS